jgi:hypothetical protein
MIERVHLYALFAFAAALALFEGPGEIFCAVAALTSIISAYKKGVAKPAWILLALLGIWVLAGIPGAASATTKLSSEDVLRPLLALAFFAGAFGLGRAGARALEKIAWIFCACLVFNAAYGYLQLAIGELPTDRLFLKNPRSSQIWVPDHIFDHTQENPSGIRGLSGLFYNRLKLAHLGVVGLGVLAIIFIARNKKPPARVAAGIGLAILSIAVVLTYARVALVAFVGAGFVLVLLSMRPRVVGAFAAISALAAVLALKLSPFASERLANAWTDLSFRRAIFSSAVAMFRDHPILGVGHGVYRTVAASYYPPEASGTWLIDAHNLFLHVACESGLVGLAAFAGAVGYALWRLVGRVRRNRESAAPAALLDRAALFGLVAILILGITHFPLHHAPVALAFWTLLGVAGSAERTDGEE